VWVCEEARRKLRREERKRVPNPEVTKSFEVSGTKRLKEDERTRESSRVERRI